MLHANETKAKNNNRFDDVSDKVASALHLRYKTCPSNPLHIVSIADCIQSLNKDTMQ